MNDVAFDASRDIEEYLIEHEHKELLRFVTVGSVDDGKSTLIGRLLHDTHGIYEDQLSAVKRATTTKGSVGTGEIDFALFTDGLKAEREQGITIDVAYRYFSTAKRKFIIADTPGHVQYTRNMATGASTANVGIILIDARLGVLQQSRRHAYIASLLGIPHLAVAVNKMDLKGYAQTIYDSICDEFGRFSKKLGFKDVTFIPISALEGDNVVTPSTKTPWYRGPTMLEYLETVEIAADRNLEDFRYPVQYVIRPDLTYRGFAAEIASGVVKKGDEVMVLPSRRTSRVKAIDVWEGELPEAFAPMSVSLRLEDEVDVSRGDMLVHPDNLPNEGQRFDAELVWMTEKPLDPNKTYFLRHTTQTVRAEIETVHFNTDLETLEHVPAETLELNDIGRVTIHTHKPLFYDPYRQNRSTGAIVLIDSITNNTVAAGMIIETERRRADSDGGVEGPPKSQVSPVERTERLGQSGATVWLTGFPGSGKSQIAFALERRLYDLGRAAIVVDPHDGLGTEPSSDGTAPRSAIEVARRATAACLVTIVAYASPKQDERAAARRLIGESFVEVHVDTSLDRSKKLDQRGAYSSAAPEFERPESPDVVVSLDDIDSEEAAAAIVKVLEKRGLLGSRAGDRRGAGI